MKKEAEKIAYNYLATKARFRITKLPKLDMRTKVGRLALQMIYKLEKDFNFDAVREKKIKRELSRNETYKSLFDTPLVKDYINNKHSLKTIHSDRLEFYGRNHWAKTEKDLRILKVLRGEKG